MISSTRFAGFNSHPKLEGTHAILSASNYHWLGDTEDQLIARLDRAQAAARGTELHAWAAKAIEMGRRQPAEGQDGYDILCAYINDAIDLGMTPEQLLFYSVHAFGTADAISFEEYVNEYFAGFLRVHDYKSGIIKASVKQLYIYAAFFCLEYRFRPFEIEGELRIYQGDTVTSYELDRIYLAKIYDTIENSNRIVVKREMGGRA